MKQYICPICGNPGVGDYCHNKIVCPTCGSDLSVFQTIHKRKNTNKLIILLSILCIAASVFFAAYFVDLRMASNRPHRRCPQHRPG